MDVKVETPETNQVKTPDAVDQVLSFFTMCAWLFFGVAVVGGFLVVLGAFFLEWIGAI